MRVSEAGRLVYINPPRTATTTTERLFHASFPDVWAPKKNAGHQTIWKSEWDNYFVFQTVRNPFTRAVSLWRRCVEALQHRNKAWLSYNKHGKISFEDLLFHDAKDVQTWWSDNACSRFDKLVPHVDLLVHQETLFRELKKVPGLKVTKARFNVSKLQVPWHRHYNQRCVEKIQEIYDADFERHGYTRDFEKAKAGDYFCDHM